MFCKATLFTVALALIASATPITPGSVRIPLQKRGNLQNADGTFNREAAIREIVKLKKYIASFMPDIALPDHPPPFAASIARTSSTSRRTSAARRSPRALRSSLWLLSPSPSRSAVASNSPTRRMISSGPARSPSASLPRASPSTSTPARPISGSPPRRARPAAATPSTTLRPPPGARRRAALSPSATETAPPPLAAHTPTLVSHIVVARTAMRSN